MEIKIYLHRTKKQNYEIADSFSVFIDLDKLPEDIIDINRGFANDCQRIIRTRDCVKKYGIAYISFMRPQYEGPEEENGNDKIYFDNEKMLFMEKKEKNL